MFRTTTALAVLVCGAGLAASAGEDAGSADVEARLNAMAAGLAGIGTEKSAAWPGFAEWFDEALGAELARGEGEEQRQAKASFGRLSAAASFATTERDGLLGLSTLRDRIDPGEFFMAVPCGVIMSLETGLKSGAAPALRGLVTEAPEAMRTGHAAMALILAWEALHLDASPHKHHIRLLPRVGSSVHPFLELFRRAAAINQSMVAAEANGVAPDAAAVAEAWAVSAVLQLPGNLFVSKVSAYEQARAAQLFEAQKQLLPFLMAELRGPTSDDDDAPDEFDAELAERLERLIWRALSWAHDIVRTRAWGGRAFCHPAADVAEEFWAMRGELVGSPEDRRDPYLIPLADMMNHASSKGQAAEPWFNAEVRNGTLGVRGWIFRNGPESRSRSDELFDRYYTNDTACNADLLFDYGFAEPVIARDCSIVIMTRNGVHHTVQIRDGNLKPTAILNTLRTNFLASIHEGCEDALEDMLAAEKAPSLTSELKALRRYRSVLLDELAAVHQRLAAYRAADISLAAPLDSPAVSGAVAVATGERRVLEAALEAVEGHWMALLKAPPGNEPNFESKVVMMQGSNLCLATDMTLVGSWKAPPAPPAEPSESTEPAEPSEPSE